MDFFLINKKGQALILALFLMILLVVSADIFFSDALVYNHSLTLLDTEEQLYYTSVAGLELIREYIYLGNDITALNGTKKYFLTNDNYFTLEYSENYIEIKAYSNEKESFLRYNVDTEKVEQI